MSDKLLADLASSVLNEIDGNLNAELTRALREGEDPEKALKDSAEYFKKILPAYIDAEVNALLNVLEMGKKGDYAAV